MTAKKQVAGKKLSVHISDNILKSAKITREEMYGHLIYLAQVLQSAALTIIPKSVNDLFTLVSLITLSKNLKKVENCTGFEDHLKLYHHKQEITSNFFVTSLAGFLIDKVDYLELEPKITATTNKKPDILIKIDNCSIYIECKTINTRKSSKFDYSSEHRKIFEKVFPHLNTPHQITITYKQEPDDIELRKICEILKRLLPQVTAPGIAYHDDNIEIHVDPRTRFGNKKIQLILHIILESTDGRYPGHVYMEKGFSVGICGPYVEEVQIFKNKLEKARKQSPQNAPFILAIDSTYIFGSPKKTKYTLSSFFKPDINSRLSGIILVTSHIDLESGYGLTFDLITNPFTMYPLSEKVRKIFI